MYFSSFPAEKAYINISIQVKLILVLSLFKYIIDMIIWAIKLSQILGLYSRLCMVAAVYHCHQITAKDKKKAVVI